MLEKLISCFSPLRRAMLLNEHCLFKQASDLDFAKTDACVTMLARYNSKKTLAQLGLDELKTCCQLLKLKPESNRKESLIAALAQKIKSEENITHPNKTQCENLIKFLDKNENKPISAACKKLKINPTSATSWLKSQGLYQKYCYRNNPILKKQVETKARARLFNKFFRLAKHFRKIDKDKNHEIVEFCEDNHLTLSKLVQISKKLKPLLRQFSREKHLLSKSEWEDIIQDWYKSKNKDLDKFCEDKEIPKTSLMVFLSRTKE